MTPSAQRQDGFTLVELMVALLIGLFLMGGLITLMQNNKRAFSSQALLSQLQDNERLAMTMMTDVIQQSGYFPNPTLNTASTAFAAVTPFAAGQSLFGVTTSGNDSIEVRYTTATGDGVLNCSGGSNTSGANQMYTNIFSIVTNATTGVSQLVCTLNGTQFPLVNGVTQMTALYGVNTSGSGGNVDTYMTAAQVPNWNNVVSVQVTLVFANPLVNTGVAGAASTPGQSTAGQPATFSIQRNISIMNQVQ